MIDDNGDLVRTGSAMRPPGRPERLGTLVFLDAAVALRAADLLLHGPSNAVAQEQALIPALLAEHAGLVVLDGAQCGRLGVFLAELGGRSRWADELADEVFSVLAAAVFNQPN